MMLPTSGASSSAAVAAAASIPLLLAAASAPSAAAAEGFVPPPPPDSYPGDPCEFYLAPSQVKEGASHGFGLGIYAGVPVPDDTYLADLDEPLVPFYDVRVDALHPPLREYLWKALETTPELALWGEGERDAAYWFAPGISSVAPCTNSNFNVALGGSGWLPGVSRRNLVEDVDVPGREDPRAGSYTYRHGLGYMAVRDIAPGQELVMECNDDQFDGGKFRDWQYRMPYNSSDPRHVCLDNIKFGDSQAAGGMGLFANLPMKKGDTILTTPVAPVHRKEVDGNGTEPRQLLLNYALGHEDSDLLLLPYGPLFSYVNHPPPGVRANAMLRWHSLDEDALSPPSRRRQKYHYPQLLEVSAERLAAQHGVGLALDVVALEDLDEEDEIYVDYGQSWARAWGDHVSGWRAPPGASAYQSADRWYHSLKDDSFVRTEKELETEPYPDNIVSMCFFDGDGMVIGRDEQNGIIYSQWQDPGLPHECIRPCNILERYPDPWDPSAFVYKAEMFHFDKESTQARMPFCTLPEGRHIAADLAWEGTLYVDRPGTQDHFLAEAFRREMDVPRGLYPDAWLRRQVRARKGADSTAAETAGVEFKRKTADRPVVTRKMLLLEEKAKSAREDL
ncbi:hypothetical protein ACHAWF_018895 [Thalassiosira exigua]